MWIVPYEGEQYRKRKFADQGPNEYPGSLEEKLDQHLQLYT